MNLEKKRKLAFIKLKILQRKLNLKIITQYLNIEGQWIKTFTMCTTKPKDTSVITYLNGIPVRGHQRNCAVGLFILPLSDKPLAFPVCEPPDLPTGIDK